MKDNVINMQIGIGIWNKNTNVKELVKEMNNNNLQIVNIRKTNQNGRRSVRLTHGHILYY